MRPAISALDYEYGDRASTEPGFANATHVVRVELRAQRIAGNPMEPKSCLARYDAGERAHSSSACRPRAPDDLKAALAQITGLRPEKFRIRSTDVGGALRRAQRNLSGIPGGDAGRQADRPAGEMARHALGDDVRRSSRAARADLTGELALDDKGNFLALRVQWLVNLGAFCSSAGPLINTVAAPTSSACSLYNVPAVHGRHRLVFTNTTPTTAYRGAGRPNVSYLWERLVEEAARRDRDRFRQAAPPQRAAQGHVPAEDADRLDL